MTLAQVPALSGLPCLCARMIEETLVSVLCIETVKSDLNPYPMVSEVLPNPQATQKCQDQHVTHTYQQDISNYCPVARQKELPEGQEHLWTEDGLDDCPRLRHPPLPWFLRNCAEGKLRLPQRKALWRLVGGEPGMAGPRMDRQVATKTPR